MKKNLITFIPLLLLVTVYESDETPVRTGVVKQDSGSATFGVGGGSVDAGAAAGSAQHESSFGPGCPDNSNRGLKKDPQSLSVSVSVVGGTASVGGATGSSSHDTSVSNGCFTSSSSVSGGAGGATGTGGAVLVTVDKEEDKRRIGRNN